MKKTNGIMVYKIKAITALIFAIGFLIAFMVIGTYNNNQASDIYMGHILLPMEIIHFYQSNSNEDIAEKNIDYDSIFYDAEKVFLEIAKKPDTLEEYASIVTGSRFVHAEDYYYLNPEEYYDSVEIIRGKAEETEDVCTINFMVRVYASDETKDMGKENPDTVVFQHRKDVKPELQFIGFYDTSDGKFHVSYERQLDRSALISAADAKGVSREGLRMVVPPRLSVRGMGEYKSVIAEMLMKIVQEPDTIHEYEAVFTEESIETVENFDWYYCNPGEVYDMVQISITEQDDSARYGVEGLIIIANENYLNTEVNKEVEEKLSDDEYFLNGLSGIAKVYLDFYLEYDVETGVFWIRNIEYRNDFHVIEDWSRGFWFTYSYDSEGKLKYQVKEGCRDEILRDENKYEKDLWNNLSAEILNSFEYYSSREILYGTTPHFFTEDELIYYSQNLFQAITLHKDILNECESRLSEESIKLIQDTKWPDAPLFLQLDWAETTWEEVELEEYVRGKTKVTTHYIGIPFEKYWEVEYTWCMTSDPYSKFEVEQIEWREKESSEVSMTLDERIPHMTRKEVSAYTGKLFLLLVREPEKIEEYKNVFTAESIENWKQVKWYYAEPERVYDDAFSAGYGSMDKEGTTVIRSHYRANNQNFNDIPVNEEAKEDSYYQNCIEGFWPEEQRDMPMFDWLVHIDWNYEGETGLIAIKRIEIIPDIHDMVGVNE